MAQLAGDGGTLADVDELLRRALELWEDNLEALGEAAHFYDAVMDDSRKAVHYARLCRLQAAALVKAMDEILTERGSAHG
jgi:hypothetical protein